MLGQSFFREFQEDPFFAHRQHMQQMQSMLVDPFAMHRNMLAANQGLDQGQGQVHSHGHGHGHGHSNRHRRRQQEVVPFGMFNPAFGFGDMFSNMRRMMNDMHRSFDVAQIQQAGPDTHMFTQSSYMSYSNAGQGAQPKVYQATTSTRQAPGGVKETRRTMRDSETGVEKIAIGHHIGERAHIMERERNRMTGDNSENQELINLDEEEAPTFDREWQEKTRYQAHHRHGDRRARHNPIGNNQSRRPQLALPESRQRNRSHRDHE